MTRKFPARQKRIRLPGSAGKPTPTFRYCRVMLPVPLSAPQEPEEVQFVMVRVEASEENTPVAVTLLAVLGSV